MAALTLAAALGGLPASRIATIRTSHEIVCVERGARRGDREVRNLPAAVPPLQAPAPSCFVRGDARARIVFLDRSRFQRPPPAFLFSHV